VTRRRRSGRGGENGWLRPRRPWPGRLRSLRWRLAAWVAIVVVISFAITFYVVYRGTGDQLRAEIDHDLRGDSAALVAALRTAAGRSSSPGDVVKPTMRAAKQYISGQSFNSTSLVLFVHLADGQTISNSPELFEVRATPDDHETFAEQAAENRVAGALLRVPAGFSDLRSSDVGELRVLRRTLMFGGAHVEVGVAEPLTSVVRAQSGVAKAFILAAALALVAALIGALLTGSQLSRPLRRIAAVAKRVDAGELSPRIEDPGPDEEARALAESFNRMLDRLTEAFDRQREFVADASHELRTPLTVIQGQLEVLAAQREPSSEDVRRVESLVRSEIARMTRLVDDLLLLARAEQAEFLRPEPIELAGFLEELWDGLKPTAERNFELTAAPDGVLYADPDRIAQALRNLLENAIEHTQPPSGLVRLTVEVGGEGRSATGYPSGRSWIEFGVQDDGPGIPPDQLGRVFDRFHRTDPARTRVSGGAGLGLSIVRAIVEAHGGEVSARRPSAGGSLIVVRLPGFDPRPPRGGERRPPAARVGGVGLDL
jgi:two-component system, OmpR family, sensor kinase